MSKFAGKVAFITGAARGQGRSHAIRLAEEGARIIAVDICADIDSVHYSMSTPDDLAETASEVEKRGGKIVSRIADVRDADALQKAFDDGVAEFGGVDVVIANAGISPMSVDEPANTWQDTIDINLTGVFNTVEAALPTMIEAGRGGSIVLISSTAGNNGVGGPTRGGLAYTASKHGVMGLMRSYANNLASHSIRVNSVHPSAVNTPMVANEATGKWIEAFGLGDGMSNALPVDLLEAVDITNAVAWLASDEARYVTGVALPVDGGASNKK
ncbi:mycofactocin-coupled SDR family oxidoreductase [Saccharopolyspora flava]|uniref:SDR family mycofactocin-dependent oxidoreductase n=1 Tax=Saccharopolyspora flava TaxID=95161 RepID=A0A1I6PBK5_9PSEU|nr:mycofactocin-coupled SDR family oxidoreductase [Saccharopolyspora flava]SFS37551.1 SDR family mycofactocin-dependent oxidoreductase [Saccharopolyspora flava]